MRHPERRPGVPEEIGTTAGKTHDEVLDDTLDEDVAKAAKERYRKTSRNL